MLYDLKNILDQQRFQRRSRELCRNEETVELKAKRAKRPSAQWGYLHLILGWYALETRERLGYVKREYFKRLCNPDIFRRVRQDPYLGEVDQMRSTRECTREELSLAIERFRSWSQQVCGIYLPAPREQAFLKSIEVETDRQAERL